MTHSRPAAGGDPVTRTVLVVEDQPQLRRLVERLVSNAGYRVITAESGADALAVLRAGAPTVDLLFTDMILPDVHGGDLARLARELHPGLRVIYTSGYAGDAVVHEGMPPGDGFLGKPYGNDELRRVLDAAFDGSAGE